jgi:MerR family transcriptional regulator, copper efflux regulator
MNIRELAALTGTPERQIRYLIAEGFMPSPSGGRANASYGDEHAEAIRRYSSLRSLGFPPAAIKRLFETGQGAPFPVMPGVTLLIAPDLLSRESDPQAITEHLRKFLEQRWKDETDGRSSAPKDR